MAIYGGPDIVTDGLVLYLDAANNKSYPGSGASWIDLSGFNTCSITNSPTFSSDNGGNFSLNGTNQRFDITCASNLIRCFNSTTQFIVKLPVYSGSQRCIFSYRGSGGSMYVGKQSSGIFVYYNELSSTSGYTAGSITDNTIIVAHIVCDSTNNMLYLYINGSLIDSGVARTGWTSTYNSIFYLGYDAGGTNEYMLGNFYSFAHYNVTLSSADIKQNYNALKGRYGL